VQYVQNTIRCNVDFKKRCYVDCFFQKVLSEDFVHLNCDHNFLNNFLNQDVFIDNTVIEISLDSIV